MEFFVKHEKEEDFTLVLPEPEDSECLDGHMDESIKNEGNDLKGKVFIATLICWCFDFRRWRSDNNIYHNRD